VAPNGATEPTGVEASFDSAAECERARSKEVADGFNQSKNKDATKNEQQGAILLMTSQCIASDDPRLAK
jgi:hypothetical protein